MSELIDRAENLAARIHSGQRRRDGKPYLDHLLSVAEILRLDGREDWIIAIGLLHDSIEDHPHLATPEIFRTNGIPDEVREIVEILTHSDSETYADYIRRVSRSRVASIVKIADITHNLTSRNLDDDHQRREKYRLSAMFLKLSHGL